MNRICDLFLLCVLIVQTSALRSADESHWSMPKTGISCGWI
jgi:hypothetical protein